jgi:hypothetical protein
VLLLAFLAPDSLALETDQYYAWARPLRDSTEALNAKVNVEIERELEAINASGSRSTSCLDVTKRISRRFRQFIFHDVELWAVNSPMVDRIPLTHEEKREFRDDYIYKPSSPFDLVGWLPPSPTIEVAGVRIGTDKLDHFFSIGWRYFRHYRQVRRKGVDPGRARSKVIDRGLLVERAFLGGNSTGILSIADLEANYRGMEFFAGLCEGESPQLQRSSNGWRMVRPFDLSRYVTPEWDESYRTPLYSARRWKKVAPRLRRYCPLLDDAEVASRRARYVSRDRVTPTEKRIAELVDEGRLPDPDRFSIDEACRGRGVAELSR